jgi:hypothetical protein
VFILAYILSPDGPSDRPTSPSPDAFFPNAIQQASHKDSDTKRNAKTKNNKNELTTIRQTKIVFFFRLFFAAILCLLAASLLSPPPLSVSFLSLSSLFSFLRRRSPLSVVFHVILLLSHALSAVDFLSPSFFSSLTLSPSFFSSLTLSPS